ncbi:hypothetical protein TU87_23015, partial [Pseudomonas weihenstephanensis]
MRWDLFDRLVRFEDNTLSVDYAYDPLGRRIHKYSNAHHKHRPEAGSHWNQNEQARKQRELGCGFALFGWDGDTWPGKAARPRPMARRVKQSTTSTNPAPSCPWLRPCVINRSAC